MLLYRMESEKIKSFEILLPDGPLNYELVTSYKLDSEKEFTITLPKKSLKDMAEVEIYKNTHPDEEHKDFNEYDDDSWDKCPCNSEDEEYKRA